MDFQKVSRLYRACRGRAENRRNRTARGAFVEWLGTCRSLPLRVPSLECVQARLHTLAPRASNAHLHTADIEVSLDVVYNDALEGREKIETVRTIASRWNVASRRNPSISVSRSSRRRRVVTCTCVTIAARTLLRRHGPAGFQGEWASRRKLATRGRSFDARGIGEARPFWFDPRLLFRHDGNRGE
jgi:hypothetical protein